MDPSLELARRGEGCYRAHGEATSNLSGTVGGGGGKRNSVDRRAEHEGAMAGRREGDAIFQKGSAQQLWVSVRVQKD